MPNTPITGVPPARVGSRIVDISGDLGYEATLTMATLAAEV